MPKEKREKDVSCDTCNQTRPSNQEWREAYPQQRLSSACYHIKRRFGTSIIPEWLQQWALDPSNEEGINPVSVVTEGEEYQAVEKDLRRRKP